MKEISEILLSIKAVQINVKEKFTWSSGIKSPIYVDNRLINSYPKERKIVVNALAKKIKSQFPNVEIITGVATGGISYAAYVSSILELPMGYVRGSKKSHGKNKEIEGTSVSGKRIVVIEDLLSTGNSSLEAINKLKDAGAKVLGLVAIFKYGLSNLDSNLKDIKYSTLTNLDEFLDVALKNSYISLEEIDIVKNFRNSI